MFVSLFFLLNLSVKATEFDDSFLADVKAILSNPKSDQVIPDDIDAITNIAPTHVNGADNLEFPAFLFESAGQIETTDLLSYTCIYDFKPQASRYGLRPDIHIARGLDGEATSGALKIETSEGCMPRVWKFNQGWRAYGTVNRISATTVLVQWSTTMEFDQAVMLDLPALNDNAEPCYYNLQEGRLQAYHMSPQKCENQMHLTNVGPSMLPSFKYMPEISSTQICKYGYVSRSGIPYLLRPRNHSTKVNRPTRMMLKMRTQKECMQPSVWSYDKTVWKQLDSVKEQTGNSPGPQDTTSFVVDWRSDGGMHVMLHLPAFVNGKACSFELVGGMVGIIPEQGQECSEIFTLYNV